MGNRRQMLDQAAALTAKHLGEIEKISAIYETDAWGKTDQDAFYNQVICIHTPYTPAVLLQKILWLERQMGRRREEKWGPRVLDMDILFFGNRMIQKENLCIPHPQLQLRKFVLVPLCEIAPGFMHPALQKTAAQLLAACTDPLAVKRVWH